MLKISWEQSNQIGIARTPGITECKKTTIQNSICHRSVWRDYRNDIKGVIRGLCSGKDRHRQGDCIFQRACFENFNSEQDTQATKQAMEDGEIEGNQVTLDLSNLRVKVASGIAAETEVALEAEVDLVAETREVFEVEEASEEEEE